MTGFLAYRILTLSPSKGEAPEGAHWSSSFDGLRMRI
jgi:hypothetical protein